MMRLGGRVAASLSLALLMSGCSIGAKIVDRELRYPGGLGGSIYDKYYVIEASASKELQLLRGSMTVAMLVAVAGANVREDSEAEAVLIHLEAATQQINYQAGTLYKSDNASPPTYQACSNGFADSCYRSTFEAGLPRLERAVFNLGFAALPKAAAVRLYEEVAQADFIGSVRASLALALASVDSMHRGAAVHRANVEIIAQTVADGKSTNSDLNALRTVQEALCYLGYQQPGGIACTDALTAAITPDVRARRNATNAYREALAAVTVEPTHFGPVFAMIRSACRELRVTKDFRDLNGRCDDLIFKPVPRPGTIG